VVKTSVIIACLQSIILNTFSQQDTVSRSSPDTKKLLFVTAANAAFYTGSFIALNKAWYKDFEKTDFHFFNDNPEWNQVDKAGHVWATYHVSRLSKGMWQWTGLNSNTSAVLGGVSGMLYQSVIELQDAYSAEWGFSWGDVGANVAGAGLFVVQELSAAGQKVSVKMSYWPKKYSGDLLERRNELFGSSAAERVLKDYNAQTYWLSANISSFFQGSKIPRWLNVAIGYGADGMYGGRSNRWQDEEAVVHDYTYIRRVREFYISPDIDLTRIRTRSKLWRSVFFVLNMVKVPAPALALQTGGGLKLQIK
jgi:hypothetical protein